MARIQNYPSDIEREAWRTFRKDFPGYRWLRNGGLRAYYNALFKKIPEWNLDMYEELYEDYVKYFSGANRKTARCRPDFWATSADSLIFVEVENTNKISERKFYEYGCLLETEEEWNPVWSLNCLNVEGFQVWTTNRYGKGVENITPRLEDYIYGP